MRKLPQPGNRVRVTGIMPNDPDPMEIGAEGTVEYVIGGDDPELVQIQVDWDNGRTLCLLGCDPFIVIGTTSAG